MFEPVEFSFTYELDTLRNFALKLKSDGNLPQHLIVDESCTVSILKSLYKLLGIILERPAREYRGSPLHACTYMRWSSGI